MQSVKVDIPDEVMTLLKRLRLGDRPAEEQVRIALAIHLFQEGVISVGKAATIAREPRATFELFLGEIGIPPVRYDLEDYQRDREDFERARQKRPCGQWLTQGR